MRVTVRLRVSYRLVAFHHSSKPLRRKKTALRSFFRGLLTFSRLLFGPTCDLIEVAELSSVAFATRSQVAETHKLFEDRFVKVGSAAETLELFENSPDRKTCPAWVGIQTQCSYGFLHKRRTSLQGPPKAPSFPGVFVVCTCALLTWPNSIPHLRLFS